MKSNRHESTSSELTSSFAVRYDDLPLAVYRELASHLSCIPGVRAQLEWNSSSTFRYGDSQIGALVVSHSVGASETRISQVLDHYGLWQRSNNTSPAGDDSDEGNSH